VRRYAARAAILFCILALSSAANAVAQVPFARYRTFETAHFIVTFEDGLEDYARRAAARGETAYTQLTRAYGVVPRGKVRLVIVDQGDVFNGFATPTPTNRIVAFAHTPVEDDLFFTSDPIELLITHELAHVFHLDESRRLFRALRNVFGRGELTFPHLFDGTSLIEGVATYYESGLTDGGRVRGARFQEILRAWLLETKGPRLDESEVDPGSWPIDRHYVFGGLFIDHLAKRYGPDTVPAWMARRAGNFGSIFTRGAGTEELFGENSLWTEWNEWIDAERGEALRLQEELRTSAPGLAETTRLCQVAHNTSFPRVSPDGSLIAFLSTDEGRQPLGLYVADLQACGLRRITRVDGAQAFAWAPDGESIVLSQFTLVDNTRVFGDLFRVEIASGSMQRLTRSARLSSPDMHPSGRTLVAVQYHNDRSRLVSVDAATGTISPLTEYSTETAWGPARWSPDGTRLAAVRFTRGVSFDLMLLSADGRVLQSLTQDRAIEGVPEWDRSAPDGIRRLFFTSERTGLRELYALELDGDVNPRLFLTARVATAIRDITIVPQDARQSTPSAASRPTTVVATVTHADGRHLERFVIDRGAWVDAPAPASDYAPRTGSPSTPPAVSDVSATRKYSPLGDLLPTGWSPVLGAVEELGPFAGASVGGIDVVGRHQWQGGLAYGPGGRAIGSVNYVYHRFPRALFFGGVASTWRLEQRVEVGDVELLRLERKRSASVGVAVPWETLRRWSFFTASFDVEERHRENAGDEVALAAADPIEQQPTLFGGSLGLSFGQTQAGLRSISVQDGIRLSATIDYLTARDEDRWRSGWEIAATAYRSFPSWTTDGRPVLAATVRVAEQRGPAAPRLTAGGIGTAAIVEGGGSNYEVRGYPAGFVTANAMWNARTELRLPIMRLSRGIGPIPLYLQGLSGSWFVDSVGAAGSANSLGAPQLLSTGGEVSTDLRLISFLTLRVRTGVGVPLKTLGPVSRGEARFYVTAGTSF
jgi:Tol biopolymer transport system component